MCRWLAYSGSPVCLEDLLFKPKNSLVVQSQHSKLGATTTNGDGFGVGWYGALETPGVFRSTEPAWNDRNLRELSALASSRRVFAHIRASTGSAVQQTNCHPFRHGRWLWMHNGFLDGFPVMKRDLAFAVDPALFHEIEGSTDSEMLFFLALTFGLHGRPACSRGSRGRPRRGDRSSARHRAPCPDDRGHHRRRHDLGVPLLDARGGRARCSTAPTSRRCATSTRTTPSCTTSPTMPASWCPSRSVTSMEHGARSRSRRA